MKERVSKLIYPCFNIVWECCIQWQALDRKLVSSELHKIILAKVQKGYKLLLKKDQISISCINAYLHIKSFITTKFHKILMSSFREVELTNCFSSIFQFGQISKFKKGIILIKKMESKFPVDMHIYTLCPS